MKGRPKEPIRARRRTGHRRKPGEVVPVRLLPPAAAGRPPAPEGLPEDAGPIWDRVVGALEGVVALRPADLFTLELMVVQYLRARQLGQLLEQFGLHGRTTRGDSIASPFLRAEREATQAFLRLAEQFGLSVASRLRLGLVQVQGASALAALHRDLEQGP